MGKKKRAERPATVKEAAALQFDRVLTREERDNISKAVTIVLTQSGPAVRVAIGLLAMSKEELVAAFAKKPDSFMDLAEGISEMKVEYEAIADAIGKAEARILVAASTAAVRADTA